MDVNKISTATCRITHLFVIRDQQVAVLGSNQTIRLAIPSATLSDILVSVNLQYPAIGDVDNVKISFIIGHWALEKDVLKGS